MVNQGRLLKIIMLRLRLPDGSQAQHDCQPEPDGFRVGGGEG